MNRKQVLEAKTTFNRWVLKIILNVWSVVTMGLFVADFFSGNKFDSTTSAVGVIYLAILGIYVSEKEYIRWHDHFISKFLGESFIIAWTSIMIMFAILAPLSEGRYVLPTEFAIVYTSVIGVFAITRHSKVMRFKENPKPLPRKR